MSIDWQRVKQVLAQAAECNSPSERAAYLDDACRGDEPLRAQVEKLLKAHDQAGPFLEQPALLVPEITAGSSTPITEKSGDRIGPYKLLQQIGEGGCGVVYMAEQEEPIRRRVALKVIKLGMDTKSVVARFEAERQALALMDHPNIARVLDAGATATGRPFFVMELVRGIRITEYCDQNQLSTEERLKLFVQVCHALQHAHQKGIIHRDIKPSNILVTVNDGMPVPKVIDFGIAKATDQRLTNKTLFTAFEQFIGTPAYMSPEQAAMTSLDIDTRSDIYALGVLLYELLTGRTPFDPKDLIASGLDEMRRILREQEPARPSTCLSSLQEADRTTVAQRRHTDPPHLIHLIRGDLDWVAMKCLEKDRTRRYESANSLAEDILRHLADEPVSARPPSRLYRLQKSVRRNRLAYSAAAVVVFALAAGIAFSSWQAMRAVRANRVAEQRLAESERARAEAEAIATFVKDMLRSPDPARDGRTITVAEILDRAAKKLDTELANQPERRAQFLNTLGRTYVALGLVREAIPLLEKARDFHLTNSGPESPETLRAMNNLAISYSHAGRRDHALKLREEVLRLRRKVLGPEHPDTLGAMQNLAVSYSQAGRRDEALKLREELLSLNRKLKGPEHSETLGAMQNLAISYSETGRRDEALRLREEVLRLSRRLKGPEHPDTLSATHGLANSYYQAGRWAEALELRQDALSLSRKLNGPEHPDTLAMMNNLAMSCSQAGRTNEALKLREEALRLRSKVLGPEHPDTLSAMNSLAYSYSQAGRRAEALQLREEALSLSRKVNRPEHPDTVWAMHQLAIAYFQAGRGDQALELYEEALRLSRKVNGPEHSETLKLMSDFAWSCSRSGRGDQALELYEEALPLSRKVNGPEHPDTLKIMINLAASRFSSGAKDEALQLREEALALSRKVNGPEHPDTLRAMLELAVSYSRAGRHPDALKLREETLALSRKVNGPDHQDTLLAMGDLAGSYYDAARHPDALNLREQVLALALKQDPMSLESAAAYDNLGFSLDAVGRGDDALKAWQESVRIAPSNSPAIYYWLGKGLVDRQRYAEAIPILRVARALHPYGDRGREVAERLALSEAASGIAPSPTPEREALMAQLAALRQTVTAHPGDTAKALHLAIAQLWLGETNQHQATCRALLAQAAKSQQPNDYDRAAKAYLLLPSPDPELLKQAAAAGRQALKLAGTNDLRRGWFMVTAALAAIRNGAPAEAEPLLTEALGLLGDNPPAKGMALACRVMARSALGRSSEAQTDFAELEKTKPAFPAPPAVSPILLLPDAMALALTCEEAKALLATPPAAKP